jgi:hypothetical protein
MPPAAETAFAMVTYDAAGRADEAEDATPAA